MNMQKVISEAFVSQFGDAPTHIVRAPGRVNLIGEHTDYNLGFALPMAIDRAIWIALRPRSDRRVWLRSVDFDALTDFSLENIEHRSDWSEYVRGMAWSLGEEGYALDGWEGVLASDVPVGSGLSSSAAIELAVARAFWALNPWDWDGARMAKVAKRHENDWMDLKTGIMDQLISAIGKKGRAFMIDFKDLSFRSVPLPERTVVVVLDTKVQRGLVDSAYNARVAECSQAAAYFGVDSLRDVSPEIFISKKAGLPDVIRKRAEHVIMENERVHEAVQMLVEGNVSGFGRLMQASHVSLRDEYEVSCAELDLMVEISMARTGCFGARMTGAGFGGCAIALVEAEAAEEFCDAVGRAYAEETGIAPDVYVCRPSNGAEGA